MNDRLLDVFKRTLELDSIDETVSQKNCEKWDSMNHLNLIIEIESEFDISLEPEEIGAMKDFSIAENLVLSKLKS